MGRGITFSSCRCCALPPRPAPHPRANVHPCASPRGTPLTDPGFVPSLGRSPPLSSRATPAPGKPEPLTVILGLMPGTHSSACSMRAGIGAQIPTSEPPARWVPVTSTGMTTCVSPPALPIPPQHNARSLPSPHTGVPGLEPRAIDPRPFSVSECGKAGSTTKSSGFVFYNDGLNALSPFKRQ